ncbi:hypothetical protein CF326_g6358 [Tilletia indica]|nr:hypothetical protein CF326_g6358 [Tilletia indica]
MPSTSSMMSSTQENNTSPTKYEEQHTPRYRAFYLGPRGTYSHSVARAAFHAVPPSAPPTPGVSSYAASSASTLTSSSSSSTSVGKEVELVPCTTITKVLETAFEAVSGATAAGNAHSESAQKVVNAKVNGGPSNGNGNGNGNGAAARYKDAEDGDATMGSKGGAAQGTLRCAYAVLPIENSTFGPVQETLEALRHAGISLDPSPQSTASSSAPSEETARRNRRGRAIIAGEYRLPVSHTLLAGPGTKKRLRELARGAKSHHEWTEIREEDGEVPLEELYSLGLVLSHEQALGQCSNFLKSWAPHARTRAVASTALAAEIALQHNYVRGEPAPNGSGRAPSIQTKASSRQPLSSSSSSSLAPPMLVAAIGAELCAEVYGLAVLRRHIEDKRDNTTRFVVVQVRSLQSSPDDYPDFDFGSVLRPFEGVPIYSTEGSPAT